MRFLPRAEPGPRHALVVLPRRRCVPPDLQCARAVSTLAMCHTQQSNRFSSRSNPRYKYFKQVTHAIEVLL